jgi:alkylated DNA repair dioxygenase AlkB
VLRASEFGALFATSAPRQLEIRCVGTHQEFSGAEIGTWSNAAELARTTAHSMSSLLDNPSHTVLDGECGWVRYFPDCVSRALAQTWFEALRDAVAWTSFRRMMYEREVDVPRLVASFELNAADLPEPIRAARSIAESLSAHVFNSVGVNRYRNGNDSVAPHNDRLDDLVHGAPIALLSLGSTRRLTLTTKVAPRRHLHLDLEAGSLLVMSYDTQLHLDHGVPKTRAPVGERISLAFRDRPALRKNAHRNRGFARMSYGEPS